MQLCFGRERADICLARMIRMIFRMTTIRYRSLLYEYNPFRKSAADGTYPAASMCSKYHCVRHVYYRVTCKKKKHILAFWKFITHTRPHSCLKVSYPTADQTLESLTFLIRYLLYTIRLHVNSYTNDLYT